MANIKFNSSSSTQAYAILSHYNSGSQTFMIRGPFPDSVNIRGPRFEYSPKRQIKKKKIHHFETVSVFFIFVPKKQMMTKKGF